MKERGGEGKKRWREGWAHEAARRPPPGFVPLRKKERHRVPGGTKRGALPRHFTACRTRAEGARGGGTADAGRRPHGRGSGSRRRLPAAGGWNRARARPGISPGEPQDSGTRPEGAGCTDRSRSADGTDRAGLPTEVDMPAGDEALVRVHGSNMTAAPPDGQPDPSGSWTAVTVRPTTPGHRSSAARGLLNSGFRTTVPAATGSTAVPACGLTMRSGSRQTWDRSTAAPRISSR